MDPLDMLKDSSDKLSEKVYTLIEEVANIKAQQKVIWAVLMLFVSGTVGTFFYIIHVLIKTHIG
jgi:hypothetical protein